LTNRGGKLNRCLAREAMESRHSVATEPTPDGYLGGSAASDGLQASAVPLYESVADSPPSRVTLISVADSPPSRVTLIIGGRMRVVIGN